MNTNIFKSYDIRGIYPSELDETAAERIGRAYIAHTDARRVAVGRDTRPSSDSLFEAFAKGVTDSGADVIDLGVISTPMVYFAAKVLDFDGVVSLTASHNPPEYNGFKLCRRNAVPIGGGSGMEEIRDLATGKLPEPADKKGAIAKEDVGKRYFEMVASHAELGNSSFRIVIDPANAMGIEELPVFDLIKENVVTSAIFDDLDPTFPNHEANPLKAETLEALKEAVFKQKADLGIAYDGDADRVGFIDETGGIVRMDTITTLLAQDILRHNPGAAILYDLRSSKAVKEAIEAAGGKAIESRVGHAHIKNQMREHKAIFAGELSGHYYFKENSYAESATLAAILMLNMLARTGKPLSKLAASVEKYFHSGEINSTVDDTIEVLDELKEKYSDGELSELDGLKVTYPTWWFNVRASNTEPVLRLNLEAETEDEMIEKRDQLLALIRG